MAMIKTPTKGEAGNRRPCCSDLRRPATHPSHPQTNLVAAPQATNEIQKDSASLTHWGALADSTLQFSDTPLLPAHQVHKRHTEEALKEAGGAGTGGSSANNRFEKKKKFPTTGSVGEQREAVHTTSDATGVVGGFLGSFTTPGKVPANLWGATRSIILIPQKSDPIQRAKHDFRT